MISESLPINAVNWHEQGVQCMSKGNYTQAVRLYEEAIVAEPHIYSHYWHLGLMLLLQEQEAEAQTTWLLAMAEGDEEQVEQWTAELIEVLQTEAERRKTLEDYSVAWAIRQHIREISPTDINNLLHLIELYIQIKTYTGKELTELGVIDLLQAQPPVELDSALLVDILEKVLNYAPLLPSSLELTETCLPYIPDSSAFVDFLIPIIYQITYTHRRQKLSIGFTNLGLRAMPQHPELLRCLATFYTDLGEHTKAIEAAKLCYFLPDRRLIDKIYDNHLVLRATMNAGICGYWDEITSHIHIQEELLESLYKEQPTDLGSDRNLVGLYNTTFFLNYFRDDPQTNNKYRTQLAQVCQANIEVEAKEVIDRYRHRLSSHPRFNTSNKRLKIGYLSHCLRRHSVGWLARWIFQHHDRERFEIYAYLLGCTEVVDSLQEWYVNHVDKAYKTGLGGMEIAELISEDEIDILIDLDSITLSTACGILSTKPAPIQVTWLGWDASAMPTIDYYIADPYVLPESAQDYYAEKIWRLPQTYIAVDGFEVGVPALRRDHLDLSSDAVVYFGVQRGVKYHPHTAMLQMKILKEVPNSYFLMKAYGEREFLDNFFIETAEAEGVSRDRLRFLPSAPSEEVHRANLGIADIVLDTYPYNGATTTLETLWMGIPMVTRVGEQFSARNSYTMMVNAGISEGIAWTDEEYVEWGIRLGKDPVLRQQISWKLRQSRQTAPLWDAKQFTREMEKAYEQMWQIYIDKSH